MKTRFRNLLGCALLMSAGAVFASPITINFSGTIYTVGSSISGDGVGVGDSVIGQFVYDTTTADTDPSSGYGLYAGQSFSISFGIGFSASSSDVSIRTQNDQQNGPATLPADGLTALAYNVTGDALNGRNIEGYQFGLRKENVAGHLWVDDAAPDLSDWAGITLADINAPDWHWMQFEGNGDPSIFDSQVRWTVDAFTASIPEPSAVFLVGMGLVGLGFAGFSKNKGGFKKVVVG